MKKILILIAAVATIATGCKGGSKGTAAGNESAPKQAVDAPEATTDPVVTAVDTPFTFEELYKIFSIFGENIMSKYYASQNAKESVKEDLEGAYNTYEEFLGDCNQLIHTTFDGDCYHGFEMACYRYKADGHILVLLLENSGCEAPMVDYIRAYEYDPATGNAVERELPLNPMPSYDDFNDIIRLAGADVASLRRAARAGIYSYNFRFDTLQVRLQDPNTYDEGVYNGDLTVNYVWNGAEFVRDANRTHNCINSDGFASIRLGEPIPDLNTDGDSHGYKVEYSPGGDLWMVSRDGVDGLEIQMEDGDVMSIEVRFPEYGVDLTAYEGVNEQPHPGALISDCIDFEMQSPVVYMYSDGSVTIEDEIWNSKIAFYTSQDALLTKVQPSYDGPIEIPDAKFKSTARIESIKIWRD